MNGPLLRPAAWRLAAMVLLASCKVGPNYVKPQVAVPASYKDAGTWTKAMPADERQRNAWWKVFGDLKLDQMQGRVDVSNQNLALAEAQYRSASAAVAQARAQLYPTVTTTPSVIRSKNSSNVTTFVPAGERTTISVPVNLSWEIDVWGKIRRAVESSEASAQASAGDLESARLSLHAQLAQSYFTLRNLDADRNILDDSARAYSRLLEITRNRYAVGVSSKGDVLQAESQMEAAQAQAIDVGVQRAQLEHAIATLQGQPAPTFSLPPDPLSGSPPPIPRAIPSEILQRRPDVAAAERRVAAANAEIGVAEGAYYPALSLGGSGGLQSSLLTNLVEAPSLIWSFGPQLAQTLFAGGALKAAVEVARAEHQGTEASYRQTVLTAFQQVEDNLAALRILAEEAEVQDRAVKAAKESVEIIERQYRAGTVGLFETLQAETNAYTIEKAAVDILGRRMVASVLLIQALGGGWE